MALRWVTEHRIHAQKLLAWLENEHLEAFLDPKVLQVRVDAFEDVIAYVKKNTRVTKRRRTG